MFLFLCVCFPSQGGENVWVKEDGLCRYCSWYHEDNYHNIFKLNCVTDHPYFILNFINIKKSSIKLLIKIQAFSFFVQ